MVWSTEANLESPERSISSRDSASAWRDLESGFESERDFNAAAMRALPEATYGVSPAGVLLTWNAGARAVYGHEAWEVVGRRVSILIPRDHIAEADAWRQRVLAGEDVGPVSTERFHHDGRRIRVTLMLSPVRDEAGAVAGVVTVTHVGQALTENWLDRLAARSEDVFYRASLRPGFAFEYVNPAMERLTGYSLKDFQNEPDLAIRLAHPDDQAKMIERVEGGNAEALENFEIRWVRRDGRVIWVELSNVLVRDEAGELVGIEGVVRDVTARQKDERELRSANERIELALRATRQGMFEIDLRVQKVVHSAGLDEVFGGSFPAGEFAVDRWLNLVVTDDASRLRILWQDVSSGRRDGFEEEYRVGSRHGETRWFVTAGRVVERDPAGRPVRFLGIHTDVTPLREAQRARLEVEERHWSLFENLAQGVIYYDSLGRATEVNPAAERILALPLAELRDRAIADSRWRFRHEDGSTFNVQEHPAAVALNTGKPVDDVVMLFTRNRQDARILLHARPQFAANGDRPSGVLVTFTDITALSEARSALGRSEERYRLIVENTPDVISRHEHGGRYVYITPNCERFFGKGPEGLIGRLPGDVGFPAAVADRISRAIETVYSTGETCEEEFTLSDFEGQTRHLQWRAFPQHDGAGVTSVVSVMQDVTSRRQLEEQFLQAQKMEAVGRLAGGVAHDFNNLLTGIQAYVSFLLSALPEDDPRRPDAEQIEQAAARAATLTRQLLAFSRRQVMQPQEIDLADVVSNIEKMLRRIVGEDIIITTGAEVPHGAVRADPGQIEQVIMNLVVNARDALPTGGKINIEVRDVEIDQEQPVPSSRAEYRPPAGRYVALSIADTGPGVPEELRAHIFEPFFTTKEKERGTGLGLSTVYGIVKQSGGHILFESEVGQGSTFTVYLPRITLPQEDAVDEPNAPAQDPRTRNETILLVEDDEMVRTLAMRSLQTVGYVVIEARDGAEALDRLREHTKRIDLVVTDVIMPGMNGRELIETIAKMDPSVPYLFMSGYTDDILTQHGIAPEDARFLEKPFTPPVLIERVRQILDGG